MDEAELTRKAIEEIMREMNTQKEADKLPQIQERKKNPLGKPNKDFLDRTLNSVMTHNKRQLESNHRKCQRKLKDMDEAERGGPSERQSRNRNRSHPNTRKKREYSSTSSSSISKERKIKRRKTKIIQKRNRKRERSNSFSSHSSSSSSTSSLSSRPSCSSSSPRKRRKPNKEGSSEDYDSGRFYTQYDDHAVPSSLGYYVDPSVALTAMAYSHVNQMLQQKQQSLHDLAKEELEDDAEDKDNVDVFSDLNLTCNSESELNVSVNSSSFEEDENGILTFTISSDEQNNREKAKLSDRYVRNQKILAKTKRKLRKSLDSESNDADDSDVGNRTFLKSKKPVMKNYYATEEVTIVNSSSESEEELYKTNEVITTIISSSTSSEADDDRQERKQDEITILSSCSSSSDNEDDANAAERLRLESKVMQTPPAGKDEDIIDLDDNEESKKEIGSSLNLQDEDAEVNQLDTNTLEGTSLNQNELNTTVNPPLQKQEETVTFNNEGKKKAETISTRHLQLNMEAEDSTSLIQNVISLPQKQQQTKNLSGDAENIIETYSSKKNFSFGKEVENSMPSVQNGLTTLENSISSKQDEMESLNPDGDIQIEKNNTTRKISLDMKGDDGMSLNQNEPTLPLEQDRTITPGEENEKEPEEKLHMKSKVEDSISMIENVSTNAKTPISPEQNEIMPLKAENGNKSETNNDTMTLNVEDEAITSLMPNEATIVGTIFPQKEGEIVNLRQNDEKELETVNSSRNISSNMESADMVMTKPQNAVLSPEKPEKRGSTSNTNSSTHLEKEGTKNIPVDAMMRNSSPSNLRELNAANAVEAADLDQNINHNLSNDFKKNEVEETIVEKANEILETKNDAGGDDVKEESIEARTKEITEEPAKDLIDLTHN